MKTLFNVTDFKGNNLGSFKSLKKAYDFSIDKIGVSDSWITCGEYHYIKMLKPTYANALERINKTSMVFIDSLGLMITINKVKL